MTRLAAAVLAAAALWWAIPSRRARRAQRLVAKPESAVAVIERVRRLRPRLGPAARRRAAAERSRTVQALGALAAELEAGQPPLAALIGAGGEPSVWPSTSMAARLGDDVCAALEHDAGQRPALGQLAACWRVGTATGSGLAAAITRLAASARATEAVRVQLEAQLAGPRATARMLAVLPLVGIGFGMMLGSDPLAWLLGTPVGLGCLTAGIALTGAGVTWTGRIAVSVERLL